MFCAPSIVLNWHSFNSWKIPKNESTYSFLFVCKKHSAIQKRKHHPTVIKFWENVNDTGSGTLFLAFALKIQDFIYHQDKNEIAVRQII